MSDRLPASLAYFLIYNPTLPAPDTAPRDDEDAQEEAHILFYTSRERVVSRDRMLRQAGLAKALVNFSEIFTPGQGCDNVHSQGKRMISLSPEPDFWMHICVDLAKTPKPNKTKVVKGISLPPPSYYYHEESVHDLALRNHLLKGYESFKLLHGTYSSMLKDRAPGTLETYLEHFFTPWAWNWDFEAINEFGAHLGLPLHPLNSSLSSLVTSFVDGLPPNTIPILLSPPYVIESSRSSVASCPLSLTRHLLFLAASSASGSIQHSRPLKGQKSSSSLTPNSHPGSTSISSNTFGFLSAAGAGMGEVMNVKKWSWPGALTFGKTASVPRSKDSSFINVQTSGSQNDSLERNESPMVVTGDQLRKNAQIDSTIKDRVQESIDQSALDDAVSSMALHGLAVVEVNGKTDNEALQSDETQTAMPLSVTSPRADPAPANTSSDKNVSPLSTIPSYPPEPAFSVLSVFLPEPSKPLVVRREQVLHMSLCQLVFALVLDAEFSADGTDEDIESLALKVSKFLEKVREKIDTDTTCRDINVTANLKNGPDRSRHVICSPHHTIFSNASFSTTSSLFFESQETLSRHPDMLEMFSRSTNPQRWFVARRGLSFNNIGDKIPGEVYLQTGVKEASLVDADNELVGAVQRWARAVN